MATEEAAELGPDASAGDLAVAAMALAVGHFLGHQDGLRAGAEPDVVHEARTALRRLRSHLRIFEGVFTPGWASELREVPAWISDALGEARDADVLFARIERYADDLARDERAEAVPLLDRLRTGRDRARERVVEMARGHEYLAAVSHLHDRLTAPPRSELAEMPARQALVDVLEASFRRVRNRVRDAGARPSDGELHAIRIRAKRLRYASEAFEAVAGKKARRYARKAEALQNVLGEHHDAVVARRALLAAVDDECAIAATFAEQAERDAGRARSAWQRYWKRLAEKRARFWRD